MLRISARPRSVGSHIAHCGLGLNSNGRLLEAYVRTVKRTSTENHLTLMIAVDQTFHALVLFALALVATG